MTVFTRYISREFFKIFLICIIIFLSIYMVVDFFEKIDNFLSVNLEKAIIIKYFLYKIPFVITQMIPVAVLISIIILFGQMKKHNEITAVKTNGIHLIKFFSGVFLIGAIMSILMFTLAEMVVPILSEKSNKIWTEKVENRGNEFFRESNHIWYKSKDAIYWIRHFDRQTNILYDPTFYFFDEAFQLIRRVDGLRGIWNGSSWRIENGIMQERNNSGGYESKEFQYLYLEIPEKPDTFSRSTIRSEDMSFSQMKEFALKVKEEGYDNTRYLVDLNLKIAFPFICFVFTMIGLPVSLLVKKGGIPLSVTIGIGLCFAYMILLGFSRTVGISGILPPILSVWLPNMILFFIGAAAIMHLDF